MLAPERALYQAAMHLTWPRALSDDDEYLCCQISELLLEDIERVGIDRNLPRCVRHDRSKFTLPVSATLSKGLWAMHAVALAASLQEAVQEYSLYSNCAFIFVCLPQARSGLSFCNLFWQCLLSTAPGMAFSMIGK